MSRRGTGSSNTGFFEIMGTQPNSGNLWDILRKEARKLEGEIDAKLAAFAKMGSETSALLAEGSEQVIQSRGAEIEALLQRLSDVDDAMSSAVNGVGDARSHTLSRHRDILMEFTQEFRRVKNNLMAQHEHNQLLGRTGDGVGPHISVHMPGSLNASGQLLRERTAIHSSTTQLEDVIAQAQATVSSLAAQRGMFLDITGKLGTLGSKFPVVSNLVTAIRRKKSKDTMILSAVVAGCTILMLLYWFNK